MTATVPDFAHTRGAERNRILKAKVLARWLWERDLTYEDVLEVDDSRRRQWARDAKVTPPNTMETWEAVRDALAAMAGYAEAHPDHPSVARPHEDERATWLGLPPVASDWFRDTPQTQAMVAEERDALDKVEEAAAAAQTVYPRGWDALVALGPVAGTPRTRA